MIDRIALKISVVPACQIYSPGLRNMLLHPDGIRIVSLWLFLLSAPQD